jgi:hypothetical protein
MPWTATLLLSIIVVALAIRWFVRANPATLVRGIRLGAIWLVVAMVLAMTVTGRLPVILGVIVPLIPLFLALLAHRRRRHPPSGDWDASSGQQSTVTTDFLDMAFDHDSGALDGRVTAGKYAGRMLSDMSLDDLRSLLQDVLAVDDAHSSSVLTTYLDRTYGDEWHGGGDDGEGRRPPERGGMMTRDEASRVLGVSPDATEQDIRAAHRRLMKQAHPDHGGSDYLASKINEAKDILLGE